MKTKTNIILINCDDLGYGDLACYGSPVNRTPYLDRMAEEGLRFTDFYMASPVCSPSRAAMMTGCYPQRVGLGSCEGRGVLFPGDAIGLNPSEITVAKLLKQAGYATKLVGKWHCGDQPEFLPTNHGFDSYYGIPFSNDMGVQKPDDIYPPLPLLRDDKVIQAQPDQSSLTERYVEESVRFLRDSHGAGQPFFLYLAHMHVHLPIYPAERFLKTSKNGRYGAAVEAIDWAAGVLLHELKTLGIDDNTLVVFTSDNGSRARDEGGSNGILRGTKGTTWEGGQRVPCIMRWPGRIPAGTTTNALSTALDFYPTFAEVADATLPADRTIDGHTLLPLLRSGGDAEAPNELFFYYIRNTLEAVRDARWKLHIRKGEPVQELYDLIDDPGETRNVLADHPEVVERLQNAIAACRHDLGDEAEGIQGKDVRPVGRVANPATLTKYNPDHPYIIAMYDLPDRG